ncbi:hypothetical protein [Marilutibacter alkalisoli]|uniref:SPOR domain-containing protein n=1 Tax=Marilutibacter alkalisoli TaxID=2591633 RepID=A0A514BUR7_9GAMM|nr:hypothetical protein [Lysobacter alkalisoli]QDH71112.1 hypothetical protein FKV23_14205 [Lysobacter alkalisoli]
MLIRALIVFLAVLNLGVAAWWIFRSDPAPAASEPLPLGVARLQLVSEVAPGELPVAEENADAPLRCFSFGPFDNDTAAVARSALGPLVERIVPRQQGDGEIRGWRVYMPPFDGPDAVQAAARALSEAGVGDMFVVRDGVEANSIALGRYGTEEAARRRVETLAGSGFTARAAPIGSGTPRVWFDVEAGPRFDPEQARSAARAPGHEELECEPQP